MTNNVYVIKNVLANRFDDVFQYPTDEYAIKRITELNTANPGFHLDEKELYKTGVIDVETGLITPLTEPVKIKIEEMTDQEFIEKQEAKAN